MEELINLGYAYNLEQIHNKREELNNLMHQQEVFWRQRSRAIWLLASKKKYKIIPQKSFSKEKEKSN